MMQKSTPLLLTGIALIFNACGTLSQLQLADLPLPTNQFLGLLIPTVLSQSKTKSIPSDAKIQEIISVTRQKP